MTKDRTTSIDITKSSRETRKQIFWHTTINDQRPWLEIHVNDNEIEGLVDNGVDVTIRSSKSRVQISLFKK